MSGSHLIRSIVGRKTTSKYALAGMPVTIANALLGGIILRFLAFHGSAMERISYPFRFGGIIMRPVVYFMSCNRRSSRILVTFTNLSQMTLVVSR